MVLSLFGSMFKVTLKVVQLKQLHKHLPHTFKNCFINNVIIFLPPGRAPGQTKVSERNSQTDSPVSDIERTGFLIPHLR